MTIYTITPDNNIAAHAKAVCINKCFSLMSAKSCSSNRHERRGDGD